MTNFNPCREDLMPRHVIERDDWDTFVRRLVREDDERIVSVLPWGLRQYEVLTVPLHTELERRS